MWDWMILTTQVARKHYHCQASDWINNTDMGENDFSADDWLIIEAARADKNKILPGMRYIKIKGVWEGEFSVFRAREDLDNICHKYELYDI